MIETQKSDEHIKDRKTILMELELHQHKRIIQPNFNRANESLVDNNIH